MPGTCTVRWQYHCGRKYAIQDVRHSPLDWSMYLVGIRCSCLRSQIENLLCQAHRQYTAFLGYYRHHTVQGYITGNRQQATQPMRRGCTSSDGCTEMLHQWSTPVEGMEHTETQDLCRGPHSRVGIARSRPEKSTPRGRSCRSGMRHTTCFRLWRKSLAGMQCTELCWSSQSPHTRQSSWSISNPATPPCKHEKIHRHNPRWQGKAGLIDQVPRP